MASSFPTNLDSFTTKQDNTDNVLAAHVNDLQAAIVATQTKLGINSSADTASVDYKLAHIVEDNITDGHTTTAPSGNAVYDALALKAPLISPSFTTPALGTPTSGNLANCTFPTLNQNTTGTAANLSGTPDLPNGTTATTQSANDNSTKLATTAYVDGKASSTFWTAISATRTSNTTVTVTGDQTAIFKKGMIVRWQESAADKVGYVSIPSTYSSPNTTITIIGDTCASIDANSFKYSSFINAFKKSFAYAGNVGAVATNVMNAWYADKPYRVIGAELSVGTAGTTNNTTVDINNGTTMFTTKPTLATTVAFATTPFTADTAKSLALGDKVTIDIDAVQSTPAIDLYVDLILLESRFLTLS